MLDHGEVLYSFSDSFIFYSFLHLCVSYSEMLGLMGSWHDWVLERKTGGVLGLACGKVRLSRLSEGPTVGPFTLMAPATLQGLGKMWLWVMEETLFQRLVGS